jgi:hypothetical protein
VGMPLFWKARISKATWWYVSTVIAGTVYLYANLFISAKTPFLLGGDQVYFWMGAQRILDGQVVYRDFFQLTPPGTDLIYAAFFKILGTHIWVPNAVVNALGVLMGCVCFSLSRQFMKSPPAALTTGLFLVLIYGKALNATHHWFAVLLVLVAVRINMKRVTEARLAFSGAMLGLAAFFNQVHGGAALLAFTFFLFLRTKRCGFALLKVVREVAVLVFAFVFMLLCLGAYYFRTAGVKKIWYCLVVYVFKYAAHSSHNTFGLPAARVSPETLLVLLPYLAIYLLLPVIYSISLWRCWSLRKNAAFPWNQVTLLSLVGVSLFLDVAISINWLRLFAVSLPGLVLTVWAVGRLQIRRRAVFMTASIALACVAVRQIEVKHVLSCARGELPGGRFATTPKAYEKLRWLAMHTRRGEFFLQAGWPGVYIPLQVRSPLYMPTLTRWDGVLDEDIQPAIQQMKARRVRYVLWTHALDEGSALGSCTDQLSIFRTYLKSSYRPAHTFDDGDVLWQKVDDRMLVTTASHNDAVQHFVSSLLRRNFCGFGFSGV